MTVFDDFARLTKTGLPQLTLLFGEDEPIVGALRDKLLALTGFDAANLSHVSYDFSDKALDADAALDELETLPFFDETKLVIFENLSNLTASRDNALDEAQAKRFEGFLSNPAPTTQLVIIIHGKLDGKRRLVKLLKKAATMLDCAPLKELEMKRLFQNELPNQILTRFLEKSNYNYAVSQQNLQLLKSYANGRDITLDMVERAIPKSFDENVFGLTDLVMHGQIQAARDLTADLTRDQNQIIPLLALLIGNFRLYTQVKIMHSLGKSEAAMTDFLKIHPYRVKLSAQTVQRFPLAYFKKALSILEQTNYDMLSGRYDKDFLLELALIKITPNLTLNP